MPALILKRFITFDWLQRVYMFMVVVRMALIIPLQVIYLQLRASELPEDKERALAVYGLLRSLGVFLRDAGAIAVFGCCFFLYLPILNYFIVPLVYKSHMKIDQNNFFTFIKNSELGRKETINKLRVCVMKVMRSNDFHGEILDQNDTSMLIQATKFRQRRLSLLRQENHSHKDMISLARNQRKHLIYLSKNPDILCPINRRPEWRNQIQKFARDTYFVSALFFWFSGSLCGLVAVWMAHIFIKNNQLIPPDWRHLTRLDRLAIMEEFVLVCFLYQSFVYPLVLLLSNVLDKLYQLSDIRKRFLWLFKELNLSQSTVGDHEAIELYIRVVHFIADLEPCLSLMSVTLSSFVSFSLLLTLTSLTFVRNIQSHELKYVFFLGGLESLVVNGALLAAAYFNAECTRVTKLVWTLIALGQQNQLDRELQSTNRLSKKDQKPPISQHTLVLWSRLVSDSNSIVNMFTSRVFGALRADYKAVLRVNFWFFSIVTLALTSNFI